MPTHLPPPPRRVRGSDGCGIWFGRIFILPHTAVGIGAVGYLLFLILWALFGREIPAVVTDSGESHSSKNGDSYTLKFRYQVGSGSVGTAGGTRGSTVGAETKFGSDGVPASVYERYKAGEFTQVTLRYFAIGPLVHAELDKVPGRGAGTDGASNNVPLLETEGGGSSNSIPVAGEAASESIGSHWGGVVVLLVWSAFWNGIMSVFWYVLWIKPLRRRQLYKRGLVTTGTVVSKRVRTGKNSTYYVAYTFRDPETGQSIKAETTVAAAAWNRAMEGQSVTVLYAANNPKRSTVYEYGGYGVDLSGVF